MSVEVPVVRAGYAGSGVTLDGRPDDEAWAQAQALDRFSRVGQDELASQRTTARVCYDRANLYVFFDCSQDRMGGVLVRYTHDHAPVWQDESVEVFVSPFSVAGESNCHQFVVNAAGAKAFLKPGWVQGYEEWSAAVERRRDGWSVEIAIPYDRLKPLGRNEDCWRIQLCRNDSVTGEGSSICPVPARYATYSRFARLVPPDAPFTFNTFRGKPVRLEPDASAPTGLAPIVTAGRELDAPRVIIPQPREVRFHPSRGEFAIGADTRIVVNDDADATDLLAAEELNDAVQKLLGKRLEVARAYAVSKSPSALRDAIVIGEMARNTVLRKACDAQRLHMLRSRHGAGAHLLDVTPERALIAGTAPADTFYGVQTLKQLMRRGQDGSVTVPAATVRDFPRFAFRGVHLLASKDALSYIGNLIEKVLAPLKVNHIVLQTDKVAWKSHPEVNDPHNSMPREDVRKLIEIAKRHHIQVTPLVQSPGHLEWAFRGGRNLDIAEDPAAPYCYCMSNPKSYEFIFSIMDEAIELFGRPEYFHAGRDEFDMRGVVPHDEKCKAIGKERLYIQDTLRVYEHLRSRGCKMMMWGDILTKPGFSYLVDELPRDILINDWRYGPAKEFPTVDFYQSNGFPVVGCTWYDPRNIFSFSRYAARRDILGMMQTTWTGFKSEEDTLRDHPEQAYAYILSAAWAWNPSAPDLGMLPYKPRLIFQRAWRGEARFEGEFASVALEAHANIARVDSGRKIGWLGFGRGNDLRGLPAGTVSVEGVPYRILPGALDAPGAVMLGGEGICDTFPRRVEGIAVGDRVRELHFLQACAFPAHHGAKVGSFVVRYDDSQTQEIPLVYGSNTFSWDDQSTGMSYGFAWRGRSADGRSVGLCGLAWTNPRPDVKVTSLRFVASDTQASPFVVAITARR